jgi:hypothetical protein
MSKKGQWPYNDASFRRKVYKGVNASDYRRRQWQHDEYQRVFKGASAWKLMLYIFLLVLVLMLAAMCALKVI